MRKILVLLSILLVAIIVLSGCGFTSWQDEESLKEIKEIQRVTDENGNVYMEILYSDGTKSEKFLLPVGVSITDVKSSHSSETRQTTITFECSDGKTQYSIVVPDGVDGSKITGARITPDSNGVPYLFLTCEDGNGNTYELEGMDVSNLKGENGVDGVDGENGVDGKDGSTWFFGEGAPASDKETDESKPAEGEASDGETTEDETVKDETVGGETTEGGAEAEKPKEDGNVSVPNSKPGDFYLNTKTYTIYTKLQDGTWKNLGAVKGSGIKDIGYFDYGIQIIVTDYDENGNAVDKAYEVYSSAIKDMTVEYNNASGMYEFSFTVTQVDGSVKTLEKVASMQRPATWFYGDDTPRDGQGALKDVATFDGDFYYAKNRSQIYVKQNGYWVSVITLNSSEEVVATCTITFDPNGGILNLDSNDLPASGGQPKIELNSEGELLSVKVVLRKGQCYPTDSYAIPVPTREGYVFKGWYKTKNISSTNAAFNDMVPVYEDITLYAIWEKVTDAE